MDLQFEGRYAGLFITRDRNFGENLERITFDGSVSLAVYQSATIALVVVIGDQHTEPVLNWLQKIHEVTEGSSLLTGIVSSRTGNPPRFDCYLFRFPLGDLSTEFASTVLDSEDCFCLVDPFEEELILLVRSSLGITLFRSFPLLPAPSTGLVPISFFEGQPAKPIRKKYDPIAAQIGEILNRSTVSAREQFQDLTKRWRASFDDPPPEQLALFDKALDEILNLMGTPLSKDYKKIDLAARVSYTGNAIQSLVEYCSRLGKQLDDYAKPPDFWTESVSYGDLARPYFLRATNRLAEDLLSRAGVSPTTKVLSVLDNNFRSLSFPNLFNRFYVKTKSEESLNILNVPRQIKLRFGALPVIAHEIAHIFVRERSSQTNDLILRMYQGHSGLFEELRSELDRARSTDRDSHIENRNYIRYKLKADRAEIGVAWMTEVLCDLIACAISGPSYVYSISRFISGTFSEFAGERVFSRTHPSFVQRVKLCLQYLFALGLEVPFDSEYLDVNRQIFPANLAQEILSLIKQPYSLEEHSRATGDVRDRLVKGQLVRESPVLVLNALWHGVMTSGDYVNEIAVVMSLQDRILDKR